MAQERAGASAHSPFGLACWSGLAQGMARSHRHDEIELNLVADGALTYLVQGATITVPVGRLALFWAAVPHRLLRAERETMVHWATVPLATFLQWPLPAAFTQDVLRGRLVLDTARWPLVVERAAFERWQADLHDGSAERRAIALLELEARVRRCALADQQTGRSGTAPGPGVPVAIVGHVEQLARFIAEHYTEPVQVGDIARAVGLHPRYAMTLFRQAFGQTLLDYLIRHRIAHAQRLLVTTDDTILDIALAAGFGSASRFYVAFKRVSDLSPSAYRMARRGPQGH